MNNRASRPLVPAEAPQILTMAPQVTPLWRAARHATSLDHFPPDRRADA